MLQQWNGSEHRVYVLHTQSQAQSKALEQMRVSVTDSQDLRSLLLDDEWRNGDRLKGARAESNEENKMRAIRSNVQIARDENHLPSNWIIEVLQSI